MQFVGIRTFPPDIPPDFPRMNSSILKEILAV